MIVRRPIESESDQRYWRRRANRQVRKARRTRSLRKWSLIAFVNLTVGIAMFYSGSRLLERLKASEEFALTRVELVGADRASVKDLGELLRPYMGRNLFEIDLGEIGAKTGTDPWVLGTSVKRQLPGTVRVTIRERTPTAVAVIGGVAHLVDGTGFVIGTHGGTHGGGASEDLPVLTGLDPFEGPTLAAALRRGVDMLGRLERASAYFAESVSELDLSREDRVVVTTVFPGPAIWLDVEDVERNVVEFVKNYDEIESRVGPMQHVDLRWSDRISVMPAMRSTLRESR